MFKARVALLGLLAMVSVSALTAAAAVASTHNFKVEGTEVSEKAEVNVEGRQTIFATTIVGLKVDISCEEVEGPSKTNVLEKEGKSKFEFDYKGCTLFSVEKTGKGKVERLGTCIVKEPFILKGEGLLKGTQGLSEDELKGTEAEEKLGTLTVEKISKESTCAVTGSFSWNGFWFQEWFDPWNWTWHIQWPDYYWWQFWHVTMSKEPVFARGSMHSNLTSGKAWSIE